MKPLLYPCSLALSLLVGSFGLSGCGGALNFPDAVAGTQASGPPVQGSVYGGHAPIVGSHVYLLQPSTSGYGGLATSILSSSSLPTNGSQATPDPYVPASWEYVTTDSGGTFDLTGLYKCIASQPVYVYSYGGNATGGTQTNTGIVQLAVLGNCPSSGAANFSPGSNDPISFIYVNEVSTVAAAYVFQPFTLPTNNSAVYIGTSGSSQALLGIANAASTAAQLYDIEGTAQVSTTDDGEGHLANYQTQLNGVANEGNGVVPQATIDSLANILAACVDSTGSTSAQCTSLFNTATDNGETSGTPATDIATAAINIARYPAGNYSAGPANVNPAYVSTLFGIPTGTVPYAPDLAAAPNDWTIAINYPYKSVAKAYASATNSSVEHPYNLAIDGNGQVWIDAWTDDDIVRWSPLGIQNAYYTNSDNLTGPASYEYGQLSIDPSNNAWVGGYTATEAGIQEFSSNGVSNSIYGSDYKRSRAVVTDPSGDAFFFAVDADAGAYDTYSSTEMWEYNSGGTLTSHSPSCNGHTAAFVYYCVSQAPADGTTAITKGDTIDNASIDAAGDLWIDSTESPYEIARVSPTGVPDWVISTGTEEPANISIDASGNGWIANLAAAATIYTITPGGASTTLTSASTGANLTWTFGSAVDGNSNIWFTNRCGYTAGCTAATSVAGTSTIVEINGSTDTAISPPTNYLPEAQYPADGGAKDLTTILDDPYYIAVDPSGNVWVTNYTGSSVVEVVGAAAPVATPLSLAAGSNKLGQRP